MRGSWKTAAGKPVANQELVQRIDSLLDGRDVEFRHVPAHRVDGDLLNAIADQAASDAAVSQRAAGTAHGDTALPQPAPERAAPAAGAKARRPARTRPAAGAATAAGASAKASSGTAPTITAKFRGTCPCGTSYAAGESITRVGARWGHPACRTAGDSPS
nr:RNase H family protein [Streptomyces sp. ODS05-4]